MNDNKTYPKWVGIIFGIILSGSAHFLSGKRLVGVMWCFGLFACGLFGLILAAVPGTVSYVLGFALILAFLALWLVMLKQSYRPIQRIGFRGWLIVIVLTVVIGFIEDYSVNQFIHTYKMPTGSMYPSLCGIRTDSIDKPSVAQQIMRGQRYFEIRAKNSGTLSGPFVSNFSPLRTFEVGGLSYELPFGEVPLKKIGEHVSSGDVLWSGVKTSGDWLFVDRISYRFKNPKRGDIVVFKTDGMAGVRADTYYLKRIAGLPNERIRIDPPHLIANDQKIMEPEIFSVISSKSDGYSGFVLARGKVPGTEAKLTTVDDVITLGEDEYFVTRPQ